MTPAMTDSKIMGVNLGAVALWTELREAMLADGVSVPERLGVNTTKVLRNVASDFIARADLANPAPTADAELEAALRDVTTALAGFVDTSATHRLPYEHPLSAYDRATQILDALRTTLNPENRRT